MRTLRTPKYLTGPDLGHPQPDPARLVRGAARRGQLGGARADPQGDLGRLPGLVSPHAAASRCAPTRAWAPWPGTTPSAPGTVPCTDAGSGAARPTLYARRVVLATGIEGSGQWQVPGDGQRRAARGGSTRTPAGTSTFPRWRGKRVAVLGAGASAFDNAATALEHGAREVRLFFRRPALVNVNAYRWAEFVGFLRHLGDLPDADKWRFILQILRMGQLPPTDTYERARAARRLSPAAGLALAVARGARRHRRHRHRRPGVRGRLRHRRHRLRHRPAAAARAGQRRAAHRPLGRPLHAAAEASATTICCATPTSGPGFELTERDAGRGALPPLPLQLHLRLPAQPGLRRAPASRA